MTRENGVLPESALLEDGRTVEVHGMHRTSAHETTLKLECLLFVYSFTVYIQLQCIYKALQYLAFEVLDLTVIISHI